MPGRAAGIALAAAAALGLAAGGPAPAAADEAPGILAVLQGELARNFAGLRDRGPDPLHYLAYEVRESEHRCVTGEFGALVHECASADRTLTIDLRVGAPELDSSHELRDRRGFAYPGGEGIPFPLEDAPAAAAVVLWAETDRAYRAAQERLAQVRASKAVKAEEGDASPDFTRESPHVERLPLGPPAQSLAPWRERIREYSRLLAAGAHTYQSRAKVEVTRENRYFASSEGSALQDGGTRYRLLIEASTRAADGMELPLQRAYHAAEPAGLPDDAAVRRAIAGLLATLDALREAPLVEPYAGPAILANEAAAVFFHEILGHRLEASELRSAQSGQTFKEKVGAPVTSPIVSVVDDPTRERFGGTPLLGAYRYDGEGQPGQRAVLVERGVLRGFLMGRTPIAGFDRSNGHGRRAGGHPAASRMGNLFVEPSASVPADRLVELLREECRRQGKPWGLLFQDVSGGFTSTGRQAPNAFKVLPLVVYRVAAGDGSRTLVRGVDIIGTPLQAFARIAAAGDDPAVFNGTCGASSGQVPVAAVSPSILFTEIEVQKKEPGQERPPLLPPPPDGRRGGAP